MKQIKFNLEIKGYNNSGLYHGNKSVDVNYALDNKSFQSPEVTYYLRNRQKINDMFKIDMSKMSRKKRQELTNTLNVFYEEVNGMKCLISGRLESISCRIGQWSGHVYGRLMIDIETDDIYVHSELVMSIENSAMATVATGGELIDLVGDMELSENYRDFILPVIEQSKEIFLHGMQEAHEAHIEDVLETGYKHC